MVELTIYVGLFFTAFAAATILPMQSEAALTALLMAGYSPALLLLVASAGNILGSTINWLLGRQVERFKDSRWFPVSEKSLLRAQYCYHRYGRWSLLLSWMPVIGDPLTFAAGTMREPFPAFLTLVSAAKIGRYLILIGAYFALKAA